MGSGHFRGCSLCREHDQCRGRFGRYVGCRRDARQVQLTLVRRAVWNRDRLFDGSFPVLSNCKDFEMAGVVSLCLCHNGFCYPTRLARRSARHVRPFMAKGHDAWQNLVAILGTTISPYLFFWQASEEVEEDKAMGRRMLRQREGMTGQEINDRKLDVGVGTFFSNIVMYFIILTCALTLHAHGVRDIDTSNQAAEALKPLAGSVAYTLYTVGLSAVGFLAVPTLTGFVRLRFRRDFSLERRLGSSLEVGALFLRGGDPLHSAGHRNGFCRDQSDKSTFLDDH